MDDYLDYASTAQTLGKPVLEDIKQGIYSAPVLFALQENNALVSELIKNEKLMKFMILSKLLMPLKKQKHLRNLIPSQL